MSERMLVLLRVEDAVDHHPEEIIRHCCKCGSEVRVWPHGQRAMREQPGLPLICNRCVDLRQGRLVVEPRRDIH